MYESQTTLAIIQGTVADVCLLDKCHSHPQLIEELTLGDACSCTRDACSASPPAVAMPSVSLGEHTFWAVPRGPPYLVHVTRAASGVMRPVFSAHHGILTCGIMTICCRCLVSCMHCDSPSFSLEAGCTLHTSFSL